MQAWLDNGATLLKPPLAALAALYVVDLELAFGDDRSRSFAFADEATTQAQASDHQHQGQCNFLHNVPLLRHTRTGDHLAHGTTSARKTQWTDFSWPQSAWDFVAIPVRANEIEAEYR